jgi:hypothetical protein
MEKAREARRLKADDPTLTNRQIADAIGLSIGATRFILRGDTWREGDALLPVASVFGLARLVGEGA